MKKSNYRIAIKKRLADQNINMKHSSIFPRPPPPRQQKTKSAATQNFGKVAVPGVTGSDSCFCQSLPGAVKWLGADRTFRGFVKTSPN